MEHVFLTHSAKLIENFVKTQDDDQASVKCMDINCFFVSEYTTLIGNGQIHC